MFVDIALIAAATLLRPPATPPCYTPCYTPLLLHQLETGRMFESMRAHISSDRLGFCYVGQDDCRVFWESLKMAMMQISSFSCLVTTNMQGKYFKLCHSEMKICESNVKYS